MARVLIIGYGNPLRCDDGLAWHAASELARLNLGKDVEVLTRHQLTPELALPVSQAETVLFLDASRIGAPGEIASRPVKPQSTSVVFTHDCTPEGILLLAEQLYGSCPEAQVVSLCGECFDHGEAVSAKVRESLPHLVQLVADVARQAIEAL